MLQQVHYIQKQNGRVLLSELKYDLVHLLAWLSPVCPEVYDRNTIQIPGQQLLELFSRAGLVVVFHC